LKFPPQQKKFVWLGLRVPLSFCLSIHVDCERVDARKERELLERERVAAGGQGTTATTGYVGGGGGEVRWSSRAHAILNYAEDNLNKEWSSGWDQGMVGGLWRPRVVAASTSVVKGRAEGDVGFNKSSSSDDYGCAIICGQTLFCDWHEAIWWQVQPSFYC
jgi:hypothetical protein